MDLIDGEWRLIRKIMRRWRVAALLVLVFVPGALGFYLHVSTTVMQRRFDRQWAPVQEWFQHVGPSLMPSPAAVVPPARRP